MDAAVQTEIKVESEDDDAYLQSPYDRDKMRLVHCGYDKAELIAAGRSVALVCYRGHCP